MKKSVRNIIILGAVLILLIAAYVGVIVAKRSRESREAADKEASVIHVCAIADADMISYPIEGKTVTLVKDDDGVWSMKDDPDFPLMQTCGAQIANAVSDLTATTKFVPGEALSEYGFSDDSKEVTVSNGEATAVIRIGGSTGTGYYVMTEGDDSIYVVTPTLNSYVRTALTELAETDSVDTVSGEEALRIELSDSEKSFTFVKSEGVWYREDENGDPAEEISKYAPAGETELMASEILHKVLSTVSAQAFGDCVAYKGDLDAYGLADTALSYTVSYTKEDAEKSYTMLIGAPSEDGTYFAKLENSNLIYKIDAENAEPLIEALKGL